MEKAFAQSDKILCPQCHEVVSSNEHSSTCTGSTTEILEVRPPQKKTPAGREGEDSSQKEFFPLVSAAHEFKTPLVVMLGYADLLRNGHLGAINERQGQVLGEIQESAERLQKLIQNLLLLYELRAAKGAPEKR